MGLQFELSERIRGLMMNEVGYDQARGALYLSKRFSERGRVEYAEILGGVVRGADDDTLAAQLRARGCFGETETSHSKTGKLIIKKVPINAADTFAEGEFNRFYVRAVCLAAIEDGHGKVEVYRARYSENPRIESEALIGRMIDAQQLLEDLRTNIGVDTCLGLPPGPNSGLSARLPIANR